MFYLKGGRGAWAATTRRSSLLAGPQGGGRDSCDHDQYPSGSDRQRVYIIDDTHAHPPLCTPPRPPTHRHHHQHHHHKHRHTHRRTHTETEIRTHMEVSVAFSPPRFSRKIKVQHCMGPQACKEGTDLTTLGIPPGEVCARAVDHDCLWRRVC